MAGNGATAIDSTCRLLTLSNGATVAEPLVANSTEKTSYVYEIANSPLPIQN